MQVGIQVINVHCYASKSPFVVCFPSTQCQPRQANLKKSESETFMIDEIKPTSLVCMMYCTRKNDENKTVTHPMGSALLHLHSNRIENIVMKDYTSNPPLKTGTVVMKITPSINLQPIQLQSIVNLRQSYSAAEANLKWIGGFGKRGLAPVVHGLKLVHSPYYINHMGMCLPSGAFCMIPTYIDNHTKVAIQSHNDRLQIALCRNMMSAEEFIQHWSNCENKPLNHHKRACLQVVADALTTHTRIVIRYTADTQLTPMPKGTERWEIPREPAADKTQSYTGDCEDYAREIYQQVKEIQQWVTPQWNTTAIETMSAILHMYVPTIEQGAVASFAHTKYITYEAEYRNHIWGGLHPRQSWFTNVDITKEQQPILEKAMHRLYQKWPKQPCEDFLPLLHLEGTGDVLPIVSERIPKTIAKIYSAKQQLEKQHPQLYGMETPDMSIQMHHASPFYKFAIACMSDVFSDCGWLDYTYTHENKYGTPIQLWAMGKAHMRPSTTHSKDTIQTFKNMMAIERPIQPLLTRSVCIQAPTPFKRFLRYGQKTPIPKIHTERETQIATYKIHDTTWYEIYFKI